MRAIVFLAALLMAISVAQATEQCINCHKSITPGIVADYQRSVMAEKGVGCLDCHGELPGHEDPSVVTHYGNRITPVPSPKYCERCHAQQVQEFMNSKHAWTALIGPFKPWYNDLVKQGKLKAGEAPSEKIMRENDPYADFRSRVTPLYPASGMMDRLGLREELDGYGNILYCLECHGSAVIVDDEGKIVKGWPNNGVGRLNPDGVPGSCASCHTRHRFSIEEARAPETCGQCHLGPDHPQIEIYEESKHGNIFFSLENKSFLKEERLTPENTPAPTCAVCHMSGFNGVPATHDVGERLYWELQPKISTPQWYPANLVATGQHSPDEAKAQQNRKNMMQVCQGCHSPRWVRMYFDEFDRVVEDYNRVAKSAKALLDRIYDEGLADKSNSLDEFPEFMWYYIWHHDGRRWRMGASMMGPDWAHWNGIVDTLMDKYGRMQAWYDTQIKIKKLEAMVEAAKTQQASDVAQTPGKSQPKTTPFVGLPVVLAVMVWMALLVKRRKW